MHIYIYMYKYECVSLWARYPCKHRPPPQRWCDVSPRTSRSAWSRQPPSMPPLIRTFMIIARDQRKLLHDWMMIVIVKQHLVLVGQMHGPTRKLQPAH